VVPSGLRGEGGGVIVRRRLVLDEKDMLALEQFVTRLEAADPAGEVFVNLAMLLTAFVAGMLRSDH
jgi:hypothetical protein